MKTLISALSKIFLALVLMIQQDTDGLVINNWLGVGAVCLALLVWAIMQVAFDSDRIWQEENYTEEDDLTWLIHERGKITVQITELCRQQGLDHRAL